jgi:hypothetical protein
MTKHLIWLLCLLGFSLLTLALDDTRATALPTTPDAPVPAAAPDTDDSWRTHRNEQAGYTVEYPSDWRVDEQTGTHGTVVATTFRPTGGGAGITVSVQRGEMDQEVSDIPNTRCKQVTVGRLTGTRCFDTVSFSISTTLVGQGKTYTITAPSKGLDQKIYQRLLESFRPIS